MGFLWDASVTAEQLKAIRVTNGQLIALRDGEGKEINDGALEGGYLDIMDYDCRHIYVPLRSGQAPWQIDGADITLGEGDWIGYNNTRGEGLLQRSRAIGWKSARGLKLCASRRSGAKPGQQHGLFKLRFAGHR